MSLPMMATPTYTLTIPSTKKQVKYRPFLVKEEKALLIAQQSEDVSVMIESLKQVIRGCVLDKVDVDKLATFDIEYIFTQIRAKSVGEIVELLFPCDEDHGEDQEPQCERASKCAGATRSASKHANHKHHNHRDEGYRR